MIMIILVILKSRLFKRLFLTLKHDVFIQHVSPKKHLVTENFEINPLRNTQNAQIECVQSFSI